MTELTPEQYTAIEIQLATARDYIRDDLRNYISKIIEPYDKVGLDDSIFEFAELVGYRINNSREDIAEDLDVKSRYGIESDNLLQPLISKAFRGHHNEDFKPDYQFDGLFGKGVHGTKINDIIKEIRNEKGGRKVADMINPETGERYVVEGGRKLADMINPETGVRYLVEASRKGNEAQGFHEWSLEEIADIHNFREESIGKGYHKNQPSWDYITSNMNEKYDKDLTTKQIRGAYDRNKDLITDEEE